MASRPQHWAQPLTISNILDEKALDRYFNTVIDRLTADMVFLRRPIGRRYWTSGLLRAAALAALAAGMLLPILAPGQHTVFGIGGTGAELALVAVITGGLIMLADQLFNVSRSWTRLMLAELKVKTVRDNLEMEWAKRRPAINAGNAATEGIALIELLDAALTEGSAVMVAQKQSWADELDEASAALRSQLESHRGSLAQTVQQQREEAARPTKGAVNITIDKPAELRGAIKIKVDGDEKASVPSPAAVLSVGNLDVGLRMIELVSERNATPPVPFSASQSIKIEPGAVATMAVRV